MVNRPLFLLIGVPVLVGLINIILPKAMQKILTLLCVGFAGLLTFVAASSPEYFEVLFGIQFLHTDKLGVFALVGTQALAFIILLFALKGVDPKIEKSFFILYPLTLGFTNGAIMADHAMAFMLFWGLSGVSLYLFGLMGKGKQAPEAARKTLMLIGGSDACLILGFVILGVLLPSSQWSMSAMQSSLSGGLAILAFVALVIAAFAKAGAFPFHTWLPPFSQEAPVESVAILPASLDKILGIYLLARIVTQLFAATIAIHLFFITIGAVSVITAVMMALTQHNGRKLLGYHAVSQVGYMIMGVGSGVPLAFAGGLFHLLNNVIYKSSLFLTLGSVEKKVGTNDLKEMGGLGKAMPMTCVMGLIGALSISGIPPFNGFFSKWMIYQGLLEKAKMMSEGYQIWLLICLILAIFGSALTLASFLKFFHAIFLGKRPKIHNDVKDAPVNQWLSTGLLSVLCIVFGVFALQLPLKHLILPILDEMGMDPIVYLGLFKSGMVLAMMGAMFLVGLIVYLVIKKVRYDENYLGGMDALEKYRVAGTEFYNEIRQMKPLCTLYDWAEEQALDLYALLGKGTSSIGGLLQKAHPGILPLYLLYIVIGMLVFMLINN